MVPRIHFNPEHNICFLAGTDNLLWISEVPNSTDPTQTTFFLAGQDAIISATKIKQYLTEVREALTQHCFM